MVLKIKTWGDKYAPKKIKQGDWIDLKARGDHKIHWLELHFIPFGVAMEMPEGYEGYILPRSSMPKNFGIIMANSQGVVDNSYRGDNDEWGMWVYGMNSSGDAVVHDGDRIAQFRIQRNQPEFDIEFVDSLNNPDRGGWGSTGIR